MPFLSSKVKVTVLTIHSAISFLNFFSRIKNYKKLLMMRPVGLIFIIGKNEI